MNFLKPSQTVALLLLLMVAISCGGGGGVTQPLALVPIVTSVTPTGIVGREGGWVRFHGVATNGPTDWVWDFSQIGTAGESTANPRVFLGSAGMGQVFARAENAEGSSLVSAINVEIGTSVITPSWQPDALTPVTSQPIPALLVTNQAVIIYQVEREGSDWTGTFLVRENTAAHGEGWHKYQDAGSPQRGFPVIGRLRPPELIEHNNNIYLRGSDGFLRGEFVACTANPIPTALTDWQSSVALTPSQVTGSGNDGVASVLGFAGDKPVLMGTSILRETQITGASFYTNYVAIANTALPDSDDDWEVLRMPDLIDGFGSGAGKRSPTGRDDAVFNQVAATLPGGGVCFVQTDVQDDLDFYYAPDEAAIRANAWRLKPLGSDVSQRGVPYGLTADADHLYLAYYPANPAVPNAYPDYSRGMGLAMSADPTGIDTPWTFQHLPDITGLRHFFFSPLVSAPLQVWGGRLIMLAEDDGNIALARALESGIPGATGWSKQRIADQAQLGANEHPFDEIYATTATHGLDFFVLYARDSAPESGAPDSPLWLSIAEGSW